LPKSGRRKLSLESFVCCVTPTAIANSCDLTSDRKRTNLLLANERRRETNRAAPKSLIDGRPFRAAMARLCRGSLHIRHVLITQNFCRSSFDETRTFLLSLVDGRRRAGPKSDSDSQREREREMNQEQNSVSTQRLTTKRKRRNRRSTLALAFVRLFSFDC
jgi:hypothetical protein